MEAITFLSLGHNLAHINKIEFLLKSYYKKYLRKLSSKPTALPSFAMAQKLKMTSPTKSKPPEKVFVFLKDSDMNEESSDKPKRKRRPTWEPKIVKWVPHIIPDDEWKEKMQELGHLIYEEIVRINSNESPKKTVSSPSFKPLTLTGEVRSKINRLFSAVGFSEAHWTDQTASSVYLTLNEELIGFGTIFREGTHGYWFTPSPFNQAFKVRAKGG